MCRLPFHNCAASCKQIFLNWVQDIGSRSPVSTVEGGFTKIIDAFCHHANLFSIIFVHTSGGGLFTFQSHQFRVAPR
jgi:hypothetical protein